ncbi:hypothetical protein TWF696_004272 [Orbilia brochopaga]|uniref:Cilia- and flagella-associated protein 157 n=1 Tax=Orbilia brochopaga TaxID=3140254 RepID=A0AAV9V8U8_9PEZI
MVTSESNPEQPSQDGSSEEDTCLKLRQEITLYNMAMDILTEKSLRDKAKINNLKEELEGLRIQLKNVEAEMIDLEHMNETLKKQLAACEAMAEDRLIQAQDLILLKVENDKLEAEIKAVQVELVAMKQEKAKVEKQNYMLQRDLEELRVRGAAQNTEISNAINVHRRNLQAEVMRKTIQNLEANNKRLNLAASARAKFHDEDDGEE